MYRTRTCGDLHLADEGLVVTLAGWVQRTRKMGGMTFVDLRDRYGITQLVFNQELDAALCEQANKLGREYVIQVTGTVRERSNKNPNLATGDIELEVSKLNVLNTAVTPPFTIEDDTDGGDDLRMKYRYLDLRRACVRKNLELRHRMAFEVRNYLDKQGFLEVETPVLVNSTPEGARDFVVPSRMNPGQFYALPQSPQTLKQLLMVSGFDRYFRDAFKNYNFRHNHCRRHYDIHGHDAFAYQKIRRKEGVYRHVGLRICNILRIVFRNRGFKLQYDSNACHAFPAGLAVRRGKHNAHDYGCRQRRLLRVEDGQTYRRRCLCRTQFCN